MAKLSTQELIDAIKELSVLELNDLVKACEEEFGVSAAAGVVVAAAAGDAAGAAEEKDDFIKAHSMGLSVVEKSDISLIRGFAPKLAFKEVMYKLIWSQYYQSKLQALRKSLDADKATGIYKITNTKNNKVYIGQAVDIGDRWTQHVKCGLGINVGTPNKFYAAMMEDGPESFTYEVLEVCDKDKLNERERYWIDFYNSVSRGYNTKVGG